VILLTEGGNDTANTGKMLSPFFRAKRARDFLFDLGHSNILFRLIIIERYTHITKKPKDFGFVAGESIPLACYLTFRFCALVS
jgi:hypothetical protein